MNNPLLEVYSDALISSIALITATGLSQRLDHVFSHDQITRFLSGADYTSCDLRVLVKPTVCAIVADDGLLIFDDTIHEKPHSDENEIIAWHLDPCANRTVKGVNLLNGLKYARGVRDRPQGRAVLRGGNPEAQAPKRYRYVLTDNGFSSKENMGKEFVMALNSNRTVALTPEDQRQSRFARVDALPLEEGAVVQGHLKGVAFPLVLAKQAFTNQDGSTGVLYLASSDLLLDYDRLTTIYQNGGTSRSSTNPRSPTPAWPARRPTPSGRKATTFSRPSRHS